MVLSKFLGKTAAKKIRSKFTHAKSNFHKGIATANENRRRQEALDSRYPGWKRRGSYKSSEAWFLANAIRCANRDGFHTRCAVATNGYGEKVKVLFIKRAARGRGLHFTTRIQL